MKHLLFIMLLCNTQLAVADDFDLYCKKNLKGKHTSKRQKSICWCIDDNLRTQATSDERTWLIQKSLPNTSKNKRTNATVTTPSDSTIQRLKSLEFDIFKNCSVNYKWKANADDIGVPDDITAP